MTHATGPNRITGAIQALRINRAIQALQAGRAIYYSGEHSGHVLTHEQGVADADIWSDYINVGMEHGSFDMAGLAHYIAGLIRGGPTSTGHRTPAVFVEAPVNGTDEANVRHNAWQFRQILGRGAHGILLCQAETPEAVRAFVESCRFPHNTIGVDPSLPTSLDRLGGAARPRVPRPGTLGIGTRGRGSEATAAAAWGISAREYLLAADPWPLNPNGELMLGVKLESPEGVARCEDILAVPGLAFAEMGPGDLGLSLGYVDVPQQPYPADMQAARDRIFAACRKHNIAFLEGCTPQTVASRIDEGVRVISGGRADTAIAGRKHQDAIQPHG